MFQEVANSLNLELSMFINLVPTQYIDNPKNSTLVLDSMFL